MPAVTPLMVKELREKTGAGMLDCKKALEANDGNIEASITWLREKGIVKAAKKADRVAAEGLCNVAAEGNVAYIYELNSETDFVAKNEKFVTLLNTVGQALLSSTVTTTEEALEYVQDAIGLMLEDVKPEDYPVASVPNELELEGQQFVMMVAFDKLAYDRKYNSKAVKKTLSIPAWLNNMAQERNVNFSNVLKKALLAELGVM